MAETDALADIAVVDLAVVDTHSGAAPPTTDEEPVVSWLDVTGEDFWDRLTGKYGPVVARFKFSQRTINNTFIRDVSDAFLGGYIEGNNDRAIYRTASFVIDPQLVQDGLLNPLEDYIGVHYQLRVPATPVDYWVEVPCGLFRLHVPVITDYYESTAWEVEASDLGIHLVDSKTVAPYTVQAGTNFVEAVTTILDNLGLRHSIVPSDKTLPADQTWEVATPWMTIVNKLLTDNNYTSCKFDRNGVAISGPYRDMNTAPVNLIYRDHFIVAPIRREQTTTRFANQVVAYAGDPNRDVLLTSVKVNDDPNSPISTVRIGRIITKEISVSGAPDQETLDAIAERELREASNSYYKVELTTHRDPRGDPWDVVLLQATNSRGEVLFDQERWAVRNWSFSLQTDPPEGTMTYTLSKVGPLVAS